MTIACASTAAAVAATPSLRPPKSTLPIDVGNYFTAINRRNLLISSLAISPILLLTPVTEARGLFQMPPVRLTNRYFLVRSGESEFESLGIINTNPVEKTSMDNGLSEKGKKQTIRTALELKKMGACDGNCWIWPSITQRAYQSAEVIAAVNGVNRSHIVPEYSFLDVRGLSAYEGKNLESVSKSNCIVFVSHIVPEHSFLDARGLGAYEGKNLESVSKVYASDPALNCNSIHIVPEYSFLDARGLGAYEGKNIQSVSKVYASDSLSSDIKPPPINDGTPNESVADVFVRVTQLMSIVETQYSEDTVIIISPDSDNLSVLQAGLLGLDLKRHAELAFSPGEIRYVDASNIPKYKQPASAVYKCLNPPKCN